MRQLTGIVIPVYLPQDVDTSLAEALLTETVAAYVAQVSDPATICLSVDGERFGAARARQLARDRNRDTFGVGIWVSEENRGKLSAAAGGARFLLECADLKYVAIVDQDGDHFANELLNLVWAAEYIEAQLGSDRVMVLGRRASRHRPLGFLRGELEEFADRVLLDALHYRAAITGHPLQLECALALDEFPDFHSGYKLFSRSTAADVFLEEAQLAGVSQACYYRHACEAVMVVEAIEHGACLGVVSRSTLNEQPVSTFGLFNLSQLIADKIIWPCRRLGVPPAFVQQWMANHAPRLLLNTLVPEGKDELRRIQRLVMCNLLGDEQVDTGPVLQSPFV
jgi:hypothetical protein